MEHMRLALQPLIQRRVDLGDRAPITEALIDVRLPQDGLASLEALNQVKERWEKTHVRVQTQSVWSGMLRLQASEPPEALTSSSAINGYAFIRDEGKSVTQARKDGFTLSRLAPYQSWETLLNSAKELWEEYAQIVQPPTICRVALRYINHIPLPSGALDLAQWFSIYPILPDGFGPIAAFQLNTVSAHPHSPSLVSMLNFSPLEQQTPADSTLNKFLLDVDVWQEGTFKTSKEIWDCIEDIHTFKNDLFFGSITDRTVEFLRSGQ